MAKVFVAIGSNIDPDENVRSALHMLAEEFDVDAISPIYLTEPLGRPGQPVFYNGVIEMTTDLPATEVKQALRLIENELGRRRSSDKYAARTVDLDILVYDRDVIEALGIPDREICNRAFLSIPLYELTPDLVLPGSNEPLKDIALRHAKHSMTPLIEYTAQLRKDVKDWIVKRLKGSCENC